MKKSAKTKVRELKARRQSPLVAPTDLKSGSTKDIAAASLIEVWIDETERRTWFLFEASRQGDTIGH